MNRAAGARFLSFAAIGGVCTVLNALLLWLLTARLGLHYLGSAALCFFVFVPASFLLNKALTFRTRRETVHIEWPRYLATMAASLAANLGLIWLLVEVAGLWYVAAYLLVTALLLAFNFLLSDRWSFGHAR